MKTKHVAIMLTDIKGFTSRTSASSRSETLELLKTHKDLVLPVIEKHAGHVVKTIGDAFLVTFESPTDAVLCGMDIQDKLKVYNVEKSAAERIDIRIAINSGEVAIADEDIFGEPVNITSRLESIAEAGQVFFTEAVYLAMNKKEVPSSEIGYRQFKGVPEKIKVYRVLREVPVGEPDPEAAVLAAAPEEAKSPAPAPVAVPLASFGRRFGAIALDFLFFMIILSTLKITSCGPDVHYKDKHNIKRDFKASGVTLNNGELKVNGKNGEEITISKDKGVQVVSPNVERVNIGDRGEMDIDERWSDSGSEKRGISLKMLFWVLYGGLLIWRFGATPGKMILKIKVVDFATGGKPTADKAFLRALFSLVSLVLLLGYLWALKEKDKRTWHDLIAGTKVVKIEK